MLSKNNKILRFIHNKLKLNKYTRDKITEIFKNIYHTLVVLTIKTLKYNLLEFLTKKIEKNITECIKNTTNNNSNNKYLKKDLRTF